jgi:membrane-bound ClpP family serine protease
MKNNLIPIGAVLFIGGSILNGLLMKFEMSGMLYNIAREGMRITVIVGVILLVIGLVRQGAVKK